MLGRTDGTMAARSGPDHSEENGTRWDRRASRPSGADAAPLMMAHGRAETGDTAMTRTEAIEQAARNNIKFHREEFPGEPIDVGEDWWDEAWAFDTSNIGILSEWAIDDTLIDKWRAAILRLAST